MNLEELRNKIDCTDKQIVELFLNRLALCEQIGEYKKAHGLPIFDGGRERELFKKVCSYSFPDDVNDVESLYRAITDIGKKRQQRQKKFGLIGKKLSHSFSPQIHGLLGEYDYRLYETDDFYAFINSFDVDGFNVTIPYKADAYKVCDVLSETAERTKSVNTVIKKDGRLFGYNTDYFGFKYLLRHNNTDVYNKKCVVLGNGGAAQTVKCVLRDSGALSVSVVSRCGELNYGNISSVYDAEIVINTTPVGMYPDNGNKVIDISAFKKCVAFVDLIYNPLKTEMMLEAERCGIKAVNGLLMLVAQGVKSAELFTGQSIDDGAVDEIACAVEDKNIILIGMPGVGKTTVGKLVAERLNLSFFDTDSVIAGQFGKTAEEIIKQYGEEYFRKLEKEVISELGKRHGCVISAGGGAVTDLENYYSLAQNGTIVYITAPTEELATDGRPVSQREGAAELYKKRSGLYAAFADITAEREATAEATAEKLVCFLGRKYEN